MSSTSSTSQEPGPRSATEILAGRYRHLFVLPRYPNLLFFCGLASFALVLVSRGIIGVLSFIPALAVLVLSASAISSATRIVDRKTVATFRRAQALLLAGELLWVLVAAIGASVAILMGSPYPLANAILFGAFACTGFEFLVIQGAFQKNAPFSLGLAAIHPVSTVLVIGFPQVTNRPDIFAVSAGVAALALIAAFPLLLRRQKTSLGHDSLALFQAFMKTWAAGDADELERIISDHSEEAEVMTKVLRLRTKVGDAFLVLPGVHPGPFHPVGSYDLPGVIAKSFKSLGPVMTLHRPGGHERNLATRKETARYAAMVADLARRAAPVSGKLRGPQHKKVGRATASATAFGDDLILTLSFAPLGSDDIDTEVEDELARFASAENFDLSVVDAHNSIDPCLQAPETNDSGWKQLFETLGASEPASFSVAYAHSSEVGFVPRRDLTENGVALLLIEGQGTKSALVLADANNSVPELRATVQRALEEAGYELVEFCTSDSHNLAARGLTVERGYEALGEATPPHSIAELVVRLAKQAEARLAPAEYGSVKARDRVKVFGSKALAEFAEITQSSSKFAKNYFRFAAVAIALLFSVSLFF